MKYIINNPKNEKKMFVILWILILLYPFINSFLGMDLGDTGIHYMNFKYLFSKPEIVGYSSFFTSLIGWGWLQIFGSLGIWGLNLLEVFVEWGLAIISYRMLSKYFNKIFTLIGILIAIIATGCYLNVFNYHQFSVLLIAGMLCAIIKANITGKIRYSLLAGILLGLSISARISSFSCIVCAILYIFWFLLNNINLKKLLKHLFMFFGTGSIICLMMLALIKVTGIWEAFMASVFRLGNMAASQSSGYSINKLINDFVFGNIDTLVSGVLTLFATISFSTGLYFVLGKALNNKEKVCNCFIGIIVGFISICMALYSYDINPVGYSPQYTTGPNYMCGILYLVAIIMFLINVKRKGEAREKSLIYLSSIFLPLLTVAGSNTQTKHIILSMWFIAPVLVNVIGGMLFDLEIKHKILELLTKKGIEPAKTIVNAGMLFLIIIIGYKFTHMVYWTNNFDSVNRLELTKSVDSSVVRYLKTTSRQANSLNSTIKSVKDLKEENKTDSLMVFGQGVMLYEILECKPYVRPWITNDSYVETDFIFDLETASYKEKKLPIIVYCRTNQYFGFKEADYSYQIDMVLQTGYQGKKEVLLNFLERENYKLYLQDDYYYVFAPSDLEEEISYDEYRYWL